MERRKKTRNFNVKKLAEFMRNPTLTPTEKCLYIDLCLYANVTGNAFPSEKLLGKDLNVGDRWIRESLKRLKRKGLLKWEKRGYSLSNLYQLNEELYFRNDRNSTTAQSGTIPPVQNGSMIPPNVSYESNKVSSSTETIQLTKKVLGNNCSPTDLRRLNELTTEYTDSWVKDALIEASNRKKPFVKVGLITKILDDWKKDGKPLPKPQKPTFIPCSTNGCDGGYIPNRANNSVYKCQCLSEFEKKFQEWKEW